MDHDDSLYTVDDVVQAFAITPRTLHYYEEVGLIKPNARTPGGHRLYGQDEIARLRHVLRIKETLGYSLQEIRTILDAEETLDRKRNTFQEAEISDDERLQIVSQAALVLQGIIKVIDTKMDKLSHMRAAFSERLAKIEQLRTDLGKADKGSGDFT